MLVATAFTALWISQPASAKPPTNWDGLAQVPAKNVDYLYLRPGADFRGYNAILLAPTEVAFKKNWRSDMNRSRRGAPQFSDADVRKVIDEAQGKLQGSFAKRFSETGFQIVQSPAPNALKVLVGVANVNVVAPELDSPGRNRVYAEDTGYATLVIEVRDSISGELLGRAVDHGVAGDSLVSLRTSVSNWADFEHLFDQWATISAKGFRRMVASTPTQ